MTFAVRSLALAAALAIAALSAPARADEPSANQLALAGKVLKDIGLQNSVEGLPPLTLSEIVNRIGQMHPEMQSALKDAATALIPEFLHSSDKVVADITHVLAVRMTEAELRDTAAFFESPVGQKYLATQPILIQEFSVASGPWRQQMANDMVTRLHDEMKKKGFDF